VKYFVDKTGRKRKGTEVNCLFCDKTFVTRKDQPNKCCSKKCCNLLRRKRIDLKCKHCGSKFNRTPSQLKLSRSGIYFCSRVCKDISQRIGGIKEIMPKHYNSGNRNSKRHRNLYRESKEITSLFCERCGYKEFECGIDIHHIDENYNNDSIDNLIALCAPCHRALHLNLWKL